HLFAGSIVDLDPDTAYEVRLSLHDPDGGSLTRTLQVRTAAILRLPATMQRRHVVPLARGQSPGGSGTERDPFHGLSAALAKARPGDLLSLAPGTYTDGPFVAASSGTRDQPIVIQGPP